MRTFTPGMESAPRDTFFSITKMAEGKNHRLLILQMFIKFFTLISLILQLHGFAITQQILDMKINLTMCALFSAYKSKR